MRSGAARVIYRLSCTVRAPIERVFDFSADPRNMASVRGPGASITKLGTEDVGLGTIFRYARNGRAWMEVEIVEYDRPKTFVTTARRGPSRPESGRMRFAERDGVTTVTSEADFALWPWFPRWVHVVVTPLALAVTYPMLWLATRYAEWVTRRGLEERR